MGAGLCLNSFGHFGKSISSNFQTQKTMVVQSVHLKAPFFGYQSVLESNETQNLYSKLQVFDK